MAEYREISSFHGRRYLATASHPTANHPGYFRPRATRPRHLYICQLQGDTSALRRPCSKGSSRSPKSGKLAGSKDNVKRFFRAFTSTRPGDPPTATRTTVKRKANRLSDVSAAPSSIAEMLAAAEDANAARGRHSHRPSLVESIRQDSAGTSEHDHPEEKPIAAGNGVSVSIALAEPMLYLQGFEGRDATDRTTTMLRGSLHLRVSKSAKIKAVTLKFRGRAETDWPEGIPPRKSEFKDVESIMNHTWTFFNAQFQTADLGHGADTVRPLKGPATTTRELDSPGVTRFTLDVRGSQTTETPTPKDVKRLSLQNNSSWSFGKGEGGTSVAQKGYLTFNPGDYIYNFELPIDSRLPESIDVELGSVRYELEATVERSGAFRANLIGSKAVTLIRVPAEGSLERVEPIAISRDWEDQLHYDIVISGKSFPLGSQVPIAFKLTPLAKIQLHRVKVYLTENTQYFGSNKRVHRIEPTKRLQLFEKRAESASTSAFPGSSMRIMSGGGVAYDSRAAAATGDESVMTDPTNLLGSLDGEHNAGPTEMEFSIQLPTCPAMGERDRRSRIHFDTTYSNIQVNHWIKIVMRLSKQDPENADKRRHFEISIDSPFHILSCRATTAATALPAYTSPESAILLEEHYECGCPGALPIRHSPITTLPLFPSSFLPSPTSLSSSPDLALPRPPLAHIHSPNQPTNPYIDTDSVASPAYARSELTPRPIHLLRAPSFNPPAFADVEDDPPPPLATPPPRYETLVDGDPRSGLADYFARLADEIGDEEDEGGRGRTRVDIPLTPGGRVNRSMDAVRTRVPVGHMA